MREPASREEEKLAQACRSWRRYARTLEDLVEALEESRPSRPAENLVMRLERRARLDQISVDLLLGEDSDSDEEGVVDLRPKSEE